MFYDQIHLTLWYCFTVVKEFLLSTSFIFFVHKWYFIVDNSLIYKFLYI